MQDDEREEVSDEELPDLPLPAEELSDPEVPDKDLPDLELPAMESPGLSTGGMGGDLIKFRTEPLPPPIPPVRHEAGIAAPPSIPLPADSLPPRVERAAPIGEQGGIGVGDNELAQQIQALTAIVQGQVGILQEIRTGVDELKGRPSGGTYS